MQLAAAIDPLSTEFLAQVKQTPIPEKVFYDIDNDLMLDFAEPDAPPFSKTLTRPSRQNDNSSLAVYQKSLGGFKPFTPSQEREFFLVYGRIKRKVHRYKLHQRSPKLISELEKTLFSLRNIIIEKNLKFVIKLAKKFWMDGNVESFENLISSGNIGLMRSIDRFDVYRRVRFLTYAANWIALEIRTELSSDNVVKVPIWWQKTLRRIHKAYQEMSSQNHRLKVSELAKKANVPVRHVKKLSNDGKTISSCDLPLLKPTVTFIEELYFDTVSKSTESQVLSQNAREIIMVEIDKLSSVEKLVLVSVFGLDGAEPKNLRQVSNILGNTGERVRQLKEKALETLRYRVTLAPEKGGLGIQSLGDLL